MSEEAKTAEAYQQHGPGGRRRWSGRSRSIQQRKARLDDGDFVLNLRDRFAHVIAPGKQIEFRDQSSPMRS